MNTKLRRGIHTIEVQAPIVAVIGAWLLNAANVIPARYAVYITMVGTACISISRGLAKLGDPSLNRTNQLGNNSVARVVPPAAAQPPTTPPPSA